MTQAQPVALWQQLQAVALALVLIRKGTSGTVALDAVAPALRPGVQALLFHVLRQLGRAQALRDQLVGRTPAPLADALLCSALALAWDETAAPYDPHTLVNQTVEAAKKNRNTQGQANFLNACLRRFLRERDALVLASDGVVADTHGNAVKPEVSKHGLVAKWNHPLWWIELLQRDYPEQWQSILEANNQAAPMAVRVNVQRTSREALLAQWEQVGLTATPVGDYGLVLEKARAVIDIPGFVDGLWSVQDPAAQCAAPLLLHGLRKVEAIQELSKQMLDAQELGFNQTSANSSVGLEKSNVRVLDACAAPGGKTAHLLELLSPNSQVIALDIDAKRCERIDQNLQRLGLKAEIVVADAAQPKTWWDGQQFDAILLDAPCSASGIVRRHPDVRWLRRASDIAQLGAIQKNLLKMLWPLLKPGGRMLYVTCSVFRQEGELQVKTFVEHNTDCTLHPCLGHLRPQNSLTPAALVDNLAGDHDGFYYALLEKRLPA
jgi:16S rRNA (cytosine967-C5)-methyltransferase